MRFDCGLNINSHFDGTLSAVLAPSADKFFSHEQAQPSDTWTIQHNLRKYPSVSIVDTAGSVFLGEVHYIDENSLAVSFAAAVAGYAYLN